MIIDLTDENGENYHFPPPGIPCLDGKHVPLAFYVDTDAGIIKTYQLPGFKNHSYAALNVPREQWPPGTLEMEVTDEDRERGIACGALYQILRGKVTIEPWGK